LDAINSSKATAKDKDVFQGTSNALTPILEAIKKGQSITQPITYKNGKGDSVTMTKEAAESLRAILENLKKSDSTAFNRLNNDLENFNKDHHLTDTIYDSFKDAMIKAGAKASAYEGATNTSDKEGKEDVMKVKNLTGNLDAKTVTFVNEANKLGIDVIISNTTSYNNLKKIREALTNAALSEPEKMELEKAINEYAKNAKNKAVTQATVEQSIRDIDTQKIGLIDKKVKTATVQAIIEAMYKTP